MLFLYHFGRAQSGTFEHKIGIFVRFWGLEPLFSGILSTKSRFLCVFTLRNHRFRASRAQNRGFCALLPSETLVFGLFEHKIVSVSRKWATTLRQKRTKTSILCSKRPKTRVPKAKKAQKWSFCAREEGDWHREERKLASGSITAETLIVNVAFLQITAHALKT